MATIEDSLHQANIEAAWLIPGHHLNIQDEIGKGRFGVVYKGSWLGSQVAVKALYGPSLDTEVTGPADRSHIEKELLTLAQLSHANVVQFFGYSVGTPAIGGTNPASQGQSSDSQKESDENPYSDLSIVMEYLPMGSVEQYIQKSNVFTSPSQSLRFRWAAQVASALAYLHNRKPTLLIHRDVKPANFLLTQSLQCKLGDFGVAKLMVSSSSSRPSEQLSAEIAPSTLADNDKVHVGTVRYMAPEVRGTPTSERPGGYSPKSDIYSHGMAMCFLFEGHPPQIDEIAEADEYFEAIRLGKRPRLKRSSEELRKVIAACLDIDPDKRPSGADLVVLLRAAKAASKKKWLFFSGRPSKKDTEAVAGIYNSIKKTDRAAEAVESI